MHSRGNSISTSRQILILCPALPRISSEMEVPGSVRLNEAKLDTFASAAVGVLEGLRQA
jgi:hypothetical protein